VYGGKPPSPLPVIDGAVHGGVGGEVPAESPPSLLDAVPVVGVGVAVAVPAVDGAKEAIVDGEVVVAGSLLGPMMGMGVAAASLGRGRRRGEGGGLSASWG